MSDADSIHVEAIYTGQARHPVDTHWTPTVTIRYGQGCAVIAITHGDRILHLVSPCPDHDCNAIVIPLDPIDP